MKSPASQAGLREGDVITSINEVTVTSIEGLVEAVSSHNPGDEIDVAFLREGAEQNVIATLSERAQVHDVFEWDEDVREHEEVLRHHEIEMREHEREMREHEREMLEHERELLTQERKMQRQEMQIERELQRQRPERPRFGVSLDEVEAGPGVRVSRVYEGSVAESAGLQEGDVITSFNKRNIYSANDLIEAVNAAPSEKKVRVEFLRAGKKLKEKVVFY